MTKTITFLISILFAINSFGQSFEGKVVYKNTYKSKMPNVADEQFTTMMGSTQEYFIKNGDYKSVGNGSFFQWQLYVNNDNKLYSKMANSETLLWNDGATNSDEILKAEVNKNVIELLGYKCDELVLTCKSGTQKYYSTQNFLLILSYLEIISLEIGMPIFQKQIHCHLNQSLTMDNLLWKA